MAPGELMIDDIPLDATREWKLRANVAEGVAVTLATALSNLLEEIDLAARLPIPVRQVALDNIKEDWDDAIKDARNAILRYQRALIGDRSASGA